MVSAASRGFAPIVPDWPDLPANVGALASTRSGGYSRAPYDDGQGGGGLNLGVHVADDLAVVERNRQRLGQDVPGRPAWLNQVHGIDVVDAAQVNASTPAPDADASIARQRGAVCVVMTADCLPVLFADVNGKVVGAAHAGWRGLANGVLGETVAAMRAAGAGDITAWLGPAIGPTRFEVGAEVLDTYLTQATNAAEAERIRAAIVAVEGRPGKFLANIYELGRCYLARSGVVNVSGGNLCTVSDAARFYSYRRDGVTGRQASLIWRK